MYRILSLDGGGVRGIVPALILKKIEERARCRIADMFDLVAATSTGAIVGLSLLRPPLNRKPERSAEEVVDFYLSTSRNVFSRCWWQRIATGNGIVGPKYRAAALERSLEQEFGETMLPEASCEVLITSYDLKTRGPYFFKSRKMNPRGGQQIQSMKDVLRATAAAPTYFTPARLKDGGRDLFLVDGGVVANNPALCAYAHAMDQVQAGTVDFTADEIAVVSIGTGAMDFDYATIAVMQGGAVAWLKPLFDIVLDGQEDAVHYQMERLLPHGRYFRLQPYLRKEIGGESTKVNEIDNASQKNLHDLRVDTLRLLDNRTEDLDRIIEAFRPKGRPKT